MEIKKYFNQINYWYIAFFVVFLLSYSCTVQQPKIAIDSIPIKTGEIFNGQVKKLQLIRLNRGERLFCNGILMATEKINKDQIEVYIAADRHQESGYYHCEYRFQENSKKIPLLDYIILDSQYPLTKLSVDKKYSNLSKTDLNRWHQEQAKLKQVYLNSFNTPRLFENAFQAPLNTKITAHFGNKRIFNDDHHSWHNGVDFRAKKGTPIASANKGKVVLTGSHYFSGNIVIIDHGQGILTLYCHLSKIKVHEGQLVEQGEIIALSGDTGRVNGPHLHWAVRVNGIWVNGLTLLTIKK